MVAPDNHWPNSTTILPDPVLVAGKAKPENSNVWEVAREEIFISDENDLILFESWNAENLSQEMLKAYNRFESLEWKSYKHMKETFFWKNSIDKLYKSI